MKLYYKLLSCVISFGETVQKSIIILSTKTMQIKELSALSANSSAQSIITPVIIPFSFLLSSTVRNISLSSSSDGACTVI